MKVRVNNYTWETDLDLQVGDEVILPATWLSEVRGTWTGKVSEIGDGGYKGPCKRITQRVSLDEQLSHIEKEIEELENRPPNNLKQALKNLGDLVPRLRTREQVKQMVAENRAAHRKELRQLKSKKDRILKAAAK